MVSPAALSIILTTFAEGPERNRALSVWGAIAGAGGAVGLLLGGVLVQLLSWRWVFFVNVPIGAAVLALAPRIVPESRSEAVAKGGYDVEGAVTITLGTIALVFTLIKAEQLGLDVGRARSPGFVVSAVLIAAFVVIERRHEDPLVPLRIFSNRSLVRRRRDAARRGGRAVRDVLLPHALPAAGARLQRAEDRGRIPAAEPDDHRRLGRGLAVRRPLHAQAGADRRSPDLDRRVRRSSPACPATATMRATWCRR